MPAYVKFQVKSSGQWLKILDSNSNAGQGSLPTADNYLWNIIHDSLPGYSDFTGYVLIQVKSSGQYLNIKDWASGRDAVACQASLPPQSDPIAPIPDYFLWQIVEDTNTGWYTIKLKSSNQFLNIYRSGDNDDTVACQGDDPGNPIGKNYLWMVTTKDPTNVTVTMGLKDCSGIYPLSNETKLNNTEANQCLSFSDDNHGAMETSDQSSFETILNAGSLVTWEPNIETGVNNSGFQVAITNITYERGPGNNILGSVMQNSGNVQAQVLYTALPPDSVDNEAYTITFTLDNGNGLKTYSIDPKIKINPSN